ncbi:protocadherin Fat 4-like [Actinia tenebrosa]|uniref:Protocadherin Fat 4-like n=1 Tax=Actinia tenebrosa TaxID=6105 RepID=A0A6P8HZQ4_ACTTE|nr:protocadherin Fat 4-like [Actinia tenebrosa]
MGSQGKSRLRTRRLWRTTWTHTIPAWLLFSYYFSSIFWLCGAVTTFHVLEEQPQGVIVGNITVNNGFTYSFDGNPTRFAIDSQTGVITTTVKIDRENLQVNPISLTIRSTDPKRQLLSVQVQVEDINDNTPSFPAPAFSFPVLETTAVGIEFPINTATDPDLGENGTIDYTIVSGNNAGKFRLGTSPSICTRSELCIVTNNSLDREDVDFYQLNISARDRGIPSLVGYYLVNITILDYNDNPPVFTLSVYDASVAENTLPGHSILRVIANDKDIGLNGEVRYFIEKDAAKSDEIFDINEATGIIRTKSTLDYETKPYFTFKVIGSDRGQPKISSSASVNINILDENDNAPYFNLVKYFPTGSSRALVPENTQVPKIVAFIRVSDDDSGVNGEVQLQITKGNELGHFVIERYPASQVIIYYLKVAHTLDREYISFYNLTLNATDRGYPRKTALQHAYIEVLDINDNSPEFSSNIYTVKISENSPNGSYVLKLNASDPDAGSNGTVSYSITSGNDLGWFQIDDKSGLVTTSMPIDRERMSLVSLTVTAQDHGPTPNSRSTLLKIDIGDINDNVPVFGKSLYTKTVSEDTSQGTSILKITATDKDSGENARITYAIDSNLQQLKEHFILEPGSGILKTNGNLNREVQSSYTIPVIARDNGKIKLTSKATVIVQVSDINDNHPIFYPTVYFVTVVENGNPANLVQVTATDQDQGSNARIFYSIESGNDNKSFAIDTNTGVIRNINSLDHETSGFHRLNITAKDGGGLYALKPAVVEITVLNQADNPPKFEHSIYNFSVYENVPKGSLVGNVFATSKDKNDTITYEIVSGDPMHLFVVDSLGGIIMVDGAIDREVQSKYWLDVVAKMGQLRPLSAKTNVNISVLDKNDNAPRFSSSNMEVNILGTWPVGTVISNETAIDQDAGTNGMVRYRLTKNANGLFKINTTSGVVTLARIVSESDDLQYTVNIFASDLGSPQLLSNMAIHANIFINHPPRFQTSSYLTHVLASRPLSYRFLVVNAVDNDPGKNGQLTYSIDPLGNQEGLFGIFPDGFIYIKKNLVHAKKGSYDIMVRATDSGTPSLGASASVTIYIQDSDEHRSLFTNNTFRFSVSENLVPGTLVGIITAKASDSSRTKDIIYSLDSSNNAFAVDARSGRITTRLVLDRESLLKATGGNNYITRAEAVYNDTTVRRDSAIVIITVTDVNDNPPHFTSALYSVKVSEDLSPGSVVFKAVAVDPDSSDYSKFTYSIISGTGNGVFSINAGNGDLYLNKKLDREALDRYNLTLEARDILDSNLSSYASVDITVEDSNDEKPVFQSFSNILTVSEQLEIDSEIININATDKDIGLNGLVVYSITCGNLAAVFDVDHSTGKIFLAKSLDYENTWQYELCITAQDQGTHPLSSTANITIHVLDANDNPPVFTTKPQQIQIMENVTKGTVIGYCSATDADSGTYGQIVYALEKQTPKGNTFRVEPNNCTISTTTLIDREKMPNGLSFFQLVVIATDKAVPKSDSLSSSKTIKVQVVDINDNKPRFISPSAAVVGASKFIMNVKAEDLDTGSNGMVTYSLISGNSDNKFYLNTSTGQLEKNTPQLNGNNLIYKLTIKAEDGGKPALSVQTEISLLKAGTAGSGPVFSNSTFLGSITENEPVGTSVTQVRAAYSQDHLNGNIKYYITSDDSKGTFSLNDTTGLITTKLPVDRESLGAVSKLVVYAVDMNGPQPKTASANVVITIHDINDNEPEFSSDKYFADVSENSSPGTSVITLTASDNDEEENKRIEYFITGGNNENKFVIDSVSGKISTRGELDRESKSQYAINVTARDYGNPSKYSTCVVIATVTDVNDNSPVFTRSYYSFSISEEVSVRTAVGSVKAIDQDSGDNGRLTYTILGLDKEVFAVNPSSGVLTLRQKLDREAVEYYVLNITATDNGHFNKYSASVSVYVNVLDVNDNPPEFDQAFYHGEVKEDAPLLTHVTFVVARDEDSGTNGQIKYSITSGNARDSFGILDNGTIVNTKVLDRESTDKYVLTIEATDQSMPPSSRLKGKARVTINVTDVNDNRPHFTSASVAHVQENVGVNDVVLTVIAVDPDRGSNSELTYTLTKIDLGAPFILGTSDGVLRVSGGLDRENKKNYTLKVTATDKGNPSLSSDMKIVIVVDDFNDHAPVFRSHSSEFRIFENVPAGTNIVKLSAVDEDYGTNAEVRYDIITGNGNGSFSINQITGKLRTAKTLDKETEPIYILKIRAYDLGVPRKESVTTVTIVLRDINDNEPVFTKSTYVTDVSENKVDSSLLTVIAEDHDDGKDGEVTYSIISGSSGGVFVIDSRTGTIALTTALDREKKQRYVLVVEARDGGVPQRSTTSTVVVNVADENDNSPVFQQKTYNAKVKEGEASGSFVIQVTAVDSDAGNNGNIMYSLVNNFGRFRIDSKSGVIVTDIALDREQINYHPLEVVATDAGNPSRQETANVNVIIEDVNDHDPEFENSLLKAAVQENASPDTIVLVVSANDKDTGLNAKSDYIITSGNDNALFSIGKESGVIAVVKQVPASPSSYTLQIKAANCKAPQRTATATVQISVSTGSFPSFLHKEQKVNVSELLPLGTTLLTVNATGHTAYFIAGGNDGDVFSIDAVYGILTIKNSLDYEQITNYTLVIGAKDGSDPPHVAFIQVFISVIDENDNAPVFSQNVYTASISEDMPINSSVLTVKAVDADSGFNAKIEYSISSQGGPSAAFGIISNTGRLFTKQVLDRENQTTYSLKIRAENINNRSMASEAAIIVVVIDINDNYPVFVDPTTVLIPEDAAVGTLVTTIKANDADEDHVLRYGFLTNSNRNGVFVMDVHNGNISLAKHLDRETQQMYSLGISVNDSKHQSISYLNITVLDVNDNAPNFSNMSYYISMPEDSQLGSAVMNVKATDADIGTNAMITYSIISLQHTSYFHIDTQTGTIHLNKAVQYKINDTNVYDLTVRAKNIYPPYQESDVKVGIEVLDTNDHAPVFTKASYSFIAVIDSSGIGSSVGAVVAYDKLDYGPNAVIRYEVTSGNGSSKFQVVPDTGDIRVKSDLTSDANKMYCVYVKAKDLGRPSMESAVQVCIDVTKPNLYAPKFGLGVYQDTAKEDTPLGSVVLSVTATDDDPGRNGEIFFSIQSGNQKEYFGIGVTNGSIYVAKPLDYEASPKYILNVTATDGAKFSKTSFVSAEITLIDINDNNPVFDSQFYQCQLPENTPVMSTLVCKVHATDPDQQGKQEIRYYIAGGDGQADFKINEVSGEIHATTMFDFESTGKSLLVVGAKDLNLAPQRFARPRASVHISITGKNEFVPVFVRDFFEGTVAENAPIGYSVLEVSATDKDAGPDGVVLYHLLGADNYKGFTLNSETGVLSISGKLDSEKSSKVSLKVIAKNLLQTDVTPGTVGHATIIVTVTDANDPPKFLKSVYNARLVESANRGTYVTNVTAVDDDQERGVRSLIRYGISAGNTNQVFTIDSLSGVIASAGDLDRETVPVYTLKVTATDNGTPPMTGNATVIVTLDDINDNPPVLSPGDRVASVLENQAAGTSIITLSAVDPDADPNRGPYKFDISVTNYGKFQLDQSSGLLRTTSSLDRESRDTYNLSIKVTDSGGLSAISYCLITVTDQNDNRPTATTRDVQVNTYNKRFPGGSIADVRPEDPDVDDVMTCGLIRSSSNMFSFPRGDCMLSSLANTGDGLYQLTINGSDGIGSVQYQVNVKFTGYTTDTVKESVAVRLQNTTPKTFLSQSFIRFIHSVENIFPQGFISQVISVKEFDQGFVDILIASRKSNTITYLEREKLADLLKNNENKLQTEAGVTIFKVDYTPCSTNSPCLNGGECSSEIQATGNTFAVNTIPLVFLSADFAWRYTCRCKPGFTGSKCEQNMNDCDPNPCQHGGSCLKNQNTFKCVCPGGYTGSLCEKDIDECQSKPCQHSTGCQNIPGSYICQCILGYTGKTCDVDIDYCQASPCMYNSTCVDRPTSFKCICDFGGRGDRCQYSSLGFAVVSYMKFPSIRSNNQDTYNNISLVFSTSTPDGLLLYNNDGTTDMDGDFISLEIVQGKIRFSYNLGFTPTPAVVVVDKVVNDGKWHHVMVIRDKKTAQVEVDSIFRGSGSVTGDFIKLELNNSPLYVGGVKDFDQALNDPRQHTRVFDFVGCIRDFYVNGNQIVAEKAIESSGALDHCPHVDYCSSSPCQNDGICVDTWFDYYCQCTDGYSGRNCQKEGNQAFRFSASSFVALEFKEGFRRQQELLDRPSPSVRSRRSVISPDESFSIKIRTLEEGLILLAQDDTQDYTLVQVLSGAVRYEFKSGNTNDNLTVFLSLETNGSWHNITLQRQGNTVSLITDNVQNRKTFDKMPHKFLGKNVRTWWLGGVTNPPAGINPAKFTGCMEQLKINDDNVPLNGPNKYLIVKPQGGGVSEGCEPRGACMSNPCVNPVEPACIDEWHGFLCISDAPCRTKPCLNNGTCKPQKNYTFVCICHANYTGELCEVCLGDYCVTSDRRTEDSPYSVGLVAGIVFLAVVLVGFVVGVLAVKRNQKLKRESEYDEKHCDDICIPTEIQDGSQRASPSHSSDDSGVVIRNPSQKSNPDLRSTPQNHDDENIVIHKMGAPEDYQLKLHKSDERIDHGFSESDVGECVIKNKYAHKHGSGQRLQPQHQLQQSTPIERNLLKQKPRSRDRKAPGSLARQVLDRRHYGPPRTEPRMRGPYMTRHHKRRTNSVDTTSSEEQQEFSDACPKSDIDNSERLDYYDLDVASIGVSEASYQYDPSMFKDSISRRDLPAFSQQEIDRLRQSSRNPPSGSFLDAISTSSEEGPTVDDKLSSLLEQADTSSESSDDTFTCSEFEYDERPTTRADETDIHNSMVFSKLPTNGNPHQRSNTASQSTLNMSDDDLIIANRFAQKPNGTNEIFDWDDVLNWGLRYHNLRGVYKDIAQLKDSIDENEEEYV